MPMQSYPGAMPVAHGTFDAGARFGAGAAPNIPVSMFEFIEHDEGNL